jgi:beta-phosphoglucomutase-like phosphatase (HAD superfamily)
MSAFFFQLELPELTLEMAEAIPGHREHVNKLFAEGRLLSYSVSLNRDMIWCVVNAEEEQEAMETIIAMPLYKYFTDVSCTPLLFHNTLPASLPGIFLN